MSNNPFNDPPVSGPPPVQQNMQAQPKYEIPVESISLPSKGLLYPVRTCT